MRLAILLSIYFLVLKFNAENQIVAEQLCDVFQDPSIDLSWLKKANGDQEEAVKWLKNEFREKKQKLGVFVKKTQPSEKKCHQCPEIDIKESLESNLFIFMSFSIPDDVWLSLGKEIEKVNGIFVLCGVPDNSFKLLSNRLLDLKKKGMNTTVQLHPQLFKHYEITQVPSFLVIEDQKFDKVTGNVSLAYALNLMSEKGETTLSKKLREEIQ